MSPPVSPRQWRYRGSGSPASRRGCLSAAKRLPCEVECRKVCETATLILAEPLRLRHLPYPRYRAAEEDIAAFPASIAF